MNDTTFLEYVVFFSAAVMILGGAIGVITLKNPVHAALGLVLTLFGVAVQFVAMEAHFLAAVQVIVYAGAIVVLFLFVIMLLGVDRASDLSVGGLFIDADREVRVGARFSVEVPLEDGTRVYVSVAEVAYNRLRDASSGFGVRFVSMDDEAAKLIAKAIETVTGFTTDVIDRPRKRKQTRDMPEMSMLPTIVPAPLTDFSDLPAPSVLDESVVLDAELDLAEERRPAAPGWWTTVSARATDSIHDARIALVEKLRRAPRFAQGIAFIGAAALTVALAITLWSGNDAKAVEPKNADGPNVPASTHQVLMGEAPIDALDAPSEEPVLVKPSTGKKRVALPPLVRIEEPKKAEAAEPKAAAAKVDAPAVRVAEAAPAKAEPAKVAPAKPEVAAAKPAPKAATEAAPKAAPKFSTAAQAILGDSEDRVKIALAPGARVLKTHVFKSPERYVIDVTDQPCPIAAPAATGAVKSVRSGRHPEYCRIVLDLAQPLEAGRWSMSGDTLVVTLSY